MTILVELAGVAIAGLVGWKARQAAHRNDCARAEQIGNQAEANRDKGNPLGAPTTAPGVVATQPTNAAATCHGRLVLHEDGSTSCHGGRDGCWGSRTGHAHRGEPVACASQSHGCGQCQTPGYQPAAGPDRSHY